MADSSNDGSGSGIPLITDGGIVYSDPSPARRRLRVAPTIADVRNTIALEAWPTPTACVRLDYARFAFDSSFPHPSISTELASLFALRAPAVTDADKLAVFGHADPIGEEAYNKTLAGRRAKAVYGLLTRQPALWDELHQGAFEGDRWGAESLQTCLTQLGYDVGAIDGKAGPLFRAGMRAFKKDNGLPEDDTVDKETRLALFGKYIDALTADEGGTGRAYDPTDFVGEAKEGDFRGAFQGCGERNLALVLSQDETNDLAPDEKRDERIRTHRPNRRVLIFLFRPADVKKMTLWPCPAASAGPDGCAKVAWSNKDDRLGPSDKRRLARRHGKTFGCRFYDWLARLSPCEAVRTTVQIWVRKEDGVRYPTPVQYELRTPSGLVRRGTSGDDGCVIEAEVPLERHVDVAWKVADANPDLPPLEPGPAELPPVDADDPSFDPIGSNAESGGGDVVPLPDPPSATVTSSGSGTFEASHVARVVLPVNDEDPARRNIQWLANLGYRADERTLAPNMARFALEYGLAQNAPPEDQSKLLRDVHTAGQEAVATDAPPPVAPPDPTAAQDETTASVRPQCCCDDAPGIDWTPAASTFVTPVPAYIPNPKERLPGLPGELLFEMPLFDGSFLHQSFSRGKSAVRDPVTGLWARDFAGAKAGEPPTPQISGESLKGVCPELKERLDWAQKRLWFHYCRERTAAGKTATPQDFLTQWLPKEQGVSAPHSTLRSAPETSMHADGCAIDIGAGAAPFICVRGRPKEPTAKEPGPQEPALYGENHKFDRDLLADTLGTPIDPQLPEPDRRRVHQANLKALGGAAGSFLSDNAYEPAMAGFDRACQFDHSDVANMQVAKWLLVKRPTKEACDPDSENAAYAKSVVEVWDNFHKVDVAWRAYTKPTTFESFRDDVIKKSAFGGEISIDADLVPLAEANNAPPASYSLLTEPAGADSPHRQRRRRTRVAMADVRANDARARAAFFQMLRDKESAEMVMVIGKLAFGPTPPPNMTPKRTIPCAWPSTWNVFVPNARNVTMGFLGISRTIVQGMAEAGLIWLGGTGMENGEPIQDFTGDIMHFDLRSLKGAGSKEMDDWLGGNVARQAWAPTIQRVASLVGTTSKSIETSSESTASARARLRFVVAGATKLDDASGVASKIDSAVQAANALGDGPLETLAKDARTSLDSLLTARTKLQTAYQFTPGQTASQHLATLESAMRKAYFSTADSDAEAALTDCSTSANAINSAVQVVRDWAPVAKMAKDVAKTLGDLAARAAKRKSPTTDHERAQAEKMVADFAKKQQAIVKEVTESL